jgi:glycosyltransferase involved in cell wall biosynthesis
VDSAQLLAAEWRAGPLPYEPPAQIPESLELEWVVPPLWPGSGGHNNFFRLMAFLEERGHRIRITIYNPRGTQSREEVLGMLRHFPALKAEPYFSNEPTASGHAVIATSWPTAYAVAAARGPAKKLYFVQDIESMFYPAGTESVLAEGSYRLGLEGITLGPWISSELEQRFGMRATPIDFQVDLRSYGLTNSGPRRSVAFYARPTTPRRGYELGILALQRFRELQPDAEINLVGWDVGRLRPSFPHVSHGVVSHAVLNDLYNRCAAALVLSMTNMSLLPLELLAAGCLPVVNDGANTRLALDHPSIRYTSLSPAAIGRDLADVYAAAADGSAAAAAAASVAGRTLDRSGEQLEAAVRAAVKASR